MEEAEITAMIELHVANLSGTANITVEKALKGVTMTYREIATSMIAEGESLVLVVYDDDNGRPLKQGDTIKGHPTIGYGRNLAGKGITEAEALALLAPDLVDAEDIARGFVGGPVWRALSDVRRAVLMDMAHNLGATRLYRFAKLRGALERTNYDQAAAEIEDSAYFRQVKTRGVRNRDAMRSGAWGSHKQVVPPVEPTGNTGEFVFTRRRGVAKLYWTGGVAWPPGSAHYPSWHHRPEKAERFKSRAEAAAMVELWPALQGTQGHAVSIEEAP